MGGDCRWRSTWRTIESGGMDRKEAMKQVAKDRGVSRRDVYQALLKK